MTLKDKELLLKDLCARLPYGVVVKDRNGVHILTLGNTEFIDLFNGKCNIVPYLFPMSSMTDEMLEELNANGFFKYRDTIANVSHLVNNGKVSEEIYTYIDIENISFLIEFFYSHHIDFRGLIEKGLALDATGKDIY